MSMNSMLPPTAVKVGGGLTSGYTSDGFAYRGLGSSFSGKAQAAIALEDWLRSEQSAENQRRFESGEAALNRAWQERMSNTAYRRAVRDMKLAGLNPVLAVSQGGSSASTPSGSSARGASGSVSSRGSVDPLSDLFAGLIRLGAGLLTKK